MFYSITSTDYSRLQQHPSQKTISVITGDIGKVTSSLRFSVHFVQFFLNSVEDLKEKSYHLAT